MDEVLIIFAWPNQTNYAKFNLYDYSLVAAIMLCSMHIWCVAAILYNWNIYLLRGQL